MVNPINNAPIGASQAESQAAGVQPRQNGAKRASAANDAAARISALAEKKKANGISAEPAIRNVDEAYETMEMVKEAILQQNGVAMAAQANLSPQRILGLI